MPQSNDTVAEMLQGFADLDEKRRDTQGRCCEIDVSPGTVVREVGGWTQGPRLTRAPAESRFCRSDRRCEPLRGAPS
jgi:hypothetical protein